MIFTYLLIISIVGIIVAMIITRKRTKKSLLQIFKSSCTIDSVQFERQLKTAQRTSHTFKKYIYTITHLSSRKALEYNSIAINKLKSLIRKKLHSDSEKAQASEFISKIRSK